ncbi:MAG TPA: hypothetical protein VH816_02950 [Gaiellaceae bacterium]|jgi:hypothetical protein
MTRPIHVELPRLCDGQALVEFLAAHGLAGSVVSVNEHCELEVHDALDSDERLRREFEAALGSWLAQHGSPLVPASSREREYVLRPPGD